MALKNDMSFSNNNIIIQDKNQKASFSSK